ncbi:MAG TPA: polysaccharide biosynthesis tyrosine autokinase [Bryobacteraceae bacterium]|jgi:capsular exopolysaccharide synthesis family protein|nr:polysaccharide biosynthesis tyrosine autokinase [Bryobacteraceae bacterium]
MSKDIEQLPAIYTHDAIAGANYYNQPPEPEEVGIPLSHYIWIIRRQAWKIVVFVLTSLIGTFIISSRLQPIYEATTTVNIDRAAPAAVVGADAQKAGIAEDSDSYIATQMKIITSDAVVRPVAVKFDLWEREHQTQGVTPAQAEVLKQSPTNLRQLRVNRPLGTYLVQISYRSTNPQLSADVANAVANSYLEHIYRIQMASASSAAGFMEKQLDELKAKMERSGQALAQFERELNVISPEEKTNIVSARLLQLNTEYTNAQADRVRKEAIFNAMKSGTPAAAMISGQGADLARLQDKLNDAQEKFAEIKSTFGPNHPSYKRAESELEEIKAQYNTTRDDISKRVQTDYAQSVNREQMLATAVAETKTEFDKINERSFDYNRLKQEAEADKRLYDELITKIHEAGINAGFENKNIAISDVALPPAAPIFPRVQLNLLIAGILSTILGIAAVILLDSLDSTIRDPDLVRRLYQTDLIGTLPLVKDGKVFGPISGMEEGAAVGASSNASNALATRSLSPFEEAVRMVRNSILLSDFDRRLRSILFTSATPGEGKTTTALHLAIAHAEQGKKTLLLDADLRRPTLHKRLGITQDLGLSNVLVGECSWKEAVAQLPMVPNLFFLPSGGSSRRAADLVGSGVADLLDQANQSFDLVVIDAPPMLGFAEPMQIAIAVDGVVVVAVAGETNRKAIGAVVATLRRLKANVLGIMLNRTSKQTGSYYYYHSYEYGTYSYYTKSAKN